MLKPADRFWRNLTRGVRVRSAKDSADALAVDTVLPWLAHDGMIHLTAPHGLEQYTGGAWGTRDVCQGSIELLLTLEHDQPVKEILRILFAQQYEESGDWPQWFMLEPYSVVQDRESHGDIIVWPLKALCDYIEATGDFAFLDETIAWRRADNFEKTPHVDPVTAHIDKLIETVRARFIPGTNLVRYGHGDWNDSLRPVDPTTSDWMTSAWTVVLLYEQLRRYAEILRRAKRAPKRAKELDALAAAVRKDFNAHLIRDGIVAGYGVFRPEGGEPELLLHPSDKETGLAYLALADDAEHDRRHVHAGPGAQALGPHPQASSLFRWRAADGQADRLSRGPGDVLPAGGIGRFLRPRNRSHVYAFAPALRRGDERHRRV